MGHGIGLSFWLIIALILLSWFFYKEPQKTHDTVEPVFGWVDNMLPWGHATAVNTTPSSAEVTCGSIENKVCGSNGVTYKNICYATFDDIVEVTAGECAE